MNFFVRDFCLTETEIQFQNTRERDETVRTPCNESEYILPTKMGDDLLRRFVIRAGFGIGVLDESRNAEFDLV